MQNNKKRSRGYAGLVILLIIVISIFASTLTDMISSVSDVLNGSDNVQSEAVLEGDITIDYLGKTYLGNAQNGFSYYSINVPVYNNGIYEMGTGYEIRLRVEGEDWTDVDDFYNNDSTNFSYCYDDIIPAATSGIAHRIYLIKDGVSQVTATFYDNSDDYYDETNGTEFTLQVPTE